MPPQLVLAGQGDSSVMHATVTLFVGAQVGVLLDHNRRGLTHTGISYISSWWPAEPLRHSQVHEAGWDSLRALRELRNSSPNHPPLFVISPG